MTAKRPRTIEPRVYPIEAASLIGVPVQRLMSMWQAGTLPAPEPDGRLRFGEFLQAYIAHASRTAREEAAAKAAAEATKRVTESFLIGL